MTQKNPNQEKLADKAITADIALPHIAKWG